jgi:hypothetical protein
MRTLFQVLMEMDEDLPILNIGFSGNGERMTVHRGLRYIGSVPRSSIRWYIPDVVLEASMWGDEVPVEA